MAFPFLDELSAGMAEVVTELGGPVTYTPAAGTPFELTATLEDPAVMDVASPGVFAVMRCMRSDFPVAPAIGDIVTINSVQCRVVDVKVNVVDICTITLNRR